MSEESKPMWGKRGRNDLETIRALGANTLRTYGNDYQENHRAFLDEVFRLDLRVIPGFSYYPYTQMAGSCIELDFDCYSVVKPWFRGYLTNGFLVEAHQGRAYHPALEHMIIINEPDAVLCQHPPGELCLDKPRNFSKGVISAIDAILDVEKELGVNGSLINFTATMTFGTCPGCTQGDYLLAVPAIRQMLELRRAFHHPEEYDYAPRNNLAEFYRTRFINSFNTHNPGSEVFHGSFMLSYQNNFPVTPLFVEEYHDPNMQDTQELSADLTDALHFVESSSFILGLTWFQFQAQYSKEENFEKKFGMFGLGNYSITPIDWYGAHVKVWCLTDSPYIQNMSTVVTQVFRGKGFDLSAACVPDPMNVPLTQDGYEQIHALNDALEMATFVQRIVEHLGGHVLYREGLLRFAEWFCCQDADATEMPGFLRDSSVRSPVVPRGLLVDDSNATTASGRAFDRMMEQLSGHPKWAVWDEYPACVADRLSDAASIGRVVHTLCMRLRWFNCSDIPEECSANPWTIGDYVFSVYAQEEYAAASKFQKPSVFDVCYFNDTAIYASSSYYDYKNGDGRCVVSGDPMSTPITEEGYHAVLAQRDNSQNAQFITRVVLWDLDANVTDVDEVFELADPDRPPPDTLVELRKELRHADWVCGGTSYQTCEEWLQRQQSKNLFMWLLSMGWTYIFLAALIGLCLTACIGTFCYVVMYNVDESDEWAARNKGYTLQLQEDILAEACSSNSPRSRDSTQMGKTADKANGVSHANGVHHNGVHTPRELRAVSVAHANGALPMAVTELRGPHLTASPVSRLASQAQYLAVPGALHQPTVVVPVYRG